MRWSSSTARTSPTASPGACARSDPAIPIVDYVSPSVWAWRPGRARAMLDYVDHVLALLPFEPEAHRRLGGPPCSYVGHPLIEQLPSLRPNAEEAARRRRRAAGAAGAAGQPPQRDPRIISAMFGAALGRLAGRGRAFERRCCRPCRICKPRSREGVASWPVKPQIVVGEAEKRAAFRIAHAALAKSGTVTLELALAGVPMVTAYRVGAIEAFILRRAIKVSVGDPRQSGDRPGGHSGVPAGGLHAGEAGAGAVRGADGFAAAPADRSRPSRSSTRIMSTGNKPPSVLRRRYRAGDDAQGAAVTGGSVGWVS